MTTHDFEAGRLVGDANRLLTTAHHCRQGGEFDGAVMLTDAVDAMYQRADPLTLFLAHHHLDELRWFYRLNPRLLLDIGRFKEAVRDQDWRLAAYHARRLKRKAVVLWA